MFTPHSITKFIGFGIFLLGYWTLTNFFVLETRFLLSFSFAGFLFILFDFINFKHERLKRIRQITRSTGCQLKAYRYLKSVMLLLSAFSIIVFPHLPISWNSDLIHRMNDAIVLLGLGIVIFLIGLRSDAEFNEMLDRISSASTFIEGSHEKLEKSLQQLQIELNELKSKLNEKSIDK